MSCSFFSMLLLVLHISLLFLSLLSIHYCILRLYWLIDVPPVSPPCLLPILCFLFQFSVFIIKPFIFIPLSPFLFHIFPHLSPQFFFLCVAPPNPCLLLLPSILHPILFHSYSLLSFLSFVLVLITSLLLCLNQSFYLLVLLYQCGPPQHHYFLYFLPSLIHTLFPLFFSQIIFYFYYLRNVFLSLHFSSPLYIHYSTDLPLFLLFLQLSSSNDERC